MPAIPAVRLAIMKPIVRTRATLMPARRAASGLAPMAYRYRPVLVRANSQDQARTTARTNGTTHGTPWRGTSEPRFTLQTTTRATPTTATTAIVATVMLERRRAESLQSTADGASHGNGGVQPDDDDEDTQPAIGLMFPLTRL